MINWQGVVAVSCQVIQQPYTFEIWYINPLVPELNVWCDLQETRI